MFNTTDVVESSRLKHQDEDKRGKLTDKEIAVAEEFLDPEHNENQRLSTVNKKVHWRDIKKVVEASDVLVQVLDARDPEGTRSADLEELAKEKGIKLVYVLNKADMVPEDNLAAWMKYYK